MIKVIEKPKVCSENKAPTLAWGRGLTPTSSQDRSSQLLVIAWDQIIQIVRVVVEEPGKQQGEKQGGDNQEENREEGKAG